MTAQQEVNPKVGEGIEKEGLATTRAERLRRVELAHTTVLIVGCSREGYQDRRRSIDRSLFVLHGDILRDAKKLAVLSDPFIYPLVASTRE